MGDRAPRTGPTRRARETRGVPPGLAQLSLVEHALCPLDATLTIRGTHLFESHYNYSDPDGRRREAKVRVTYPNGLSASDELYLWGLIGLTFAQPEPPRELHATPHYCLRQLGFLDWSSRGGENYRVFRSALWRLAAVTYFSTAFYDPIRREHRDRSFGFLKYDLPLDPKSSRAWRIVWDPLFHEFCAATGGRLFFDLAVYRSLDCASRRLFLFLHKLFWRRRETPHIDVGHLTRDVLGFSPTVAMKDLKVKLNRCIGALHDSGVLTFPADAKQPTDLYHKVGPGQYTVVFHRGPYFDRPHRSSALTEASDSPVYDQLRSIGLDDAAIRRTLRSYPLPLINDWTDITLAAKEQNGDGFFTKSSAAYFLDNLKHASAGKRTPPDWWRELRKQEARKRDEIARDSGEPRDINAAAAFRAYIEGTAREAFEHSMSRIFEDLKRAGTPTREARERAVYIAQMNFHGKFRREHPEHRDADLPLDGTPPNPSLF